MWFVNISLMPFLFCSSLSEVEPYSPDALVFWSLTMICWVPMFGYLSKLVLSELPGSVVCCLSLILKTSQLDIITWYFSLPFFLLLLVFPFRIYCTFSNCLTVLGHSVLFFPLFIFQSSFSWHIFELTGSFIDHVQSTDDPLKTFFISVTVFWNLYVLFILS